MGDLVGKNIQYKSFRKRPPRKFEKVVVTRAGHVRELALLSDRMVAHERFGKSLVIHKEKTKKLMFNECLYI